MSEHMGIKGKCMFYHSPEDEDWGFAYCNRCKKICGSLLVEFHQGFTSDWIQVECPKCKHTIWTAKLKYRKILKAKDDLKCFICKKKTNYYDCNAYSDDKEIFCSNKCYNKYQKMEDKK